MLYIILSKVGFYAWVKYMLEEFLRRSALFDLYGALLTEKQQRCLSMSLFDDYSLSEIGEALGISRQAVHDMLRWRTTKHGWDCSRAATPKERRLRRCMKA